MKPVQQNLSDNCFQACIASIFEVPISRVPHFFKGSKPGDIWTQKQWDRVMKWAERREHQACWLDPTTEADLKFIEMLEATDLYYVGFGDSWVNNGGGHCIVMHKGKNIHDPKGCSFLKSKPWLYVLFEPKSKESLASMIPDVEIAA